MTATATWPAGPTAATPTAILTCSDSPAITILALATRCSTVIGGKFVTDDKITSASIKFQNDEVVEIRQNNQRISYTNQESMGMNSSNNLTRTFATYTDGGNFRYRTLVEYFKYKN